MIREDIAFAYISPNPLKSTGSNQVNQYNRFNPESDKLRVRFLVVKR